MGSPVSLPLVPQTSVGLLARLSLGSPNFLRQLGSCGGLSRSSAATLLHTQSSAPSLTNALLIYCQIARMGDARPTPNSDETNGWKETLAGAGLISQLAPLLRHVDAGVRAKACCLLGNLCRLSSSFYEPARREGLLPLLSHCCADADPSVRKFAAFAAGNAGFHSRRLYAALEPAIPSLVSSLASDDAKTRANAAGALGNLARNGPELAHSLCAAGAPAALLRLVNLAADALDDDANQHHHQVVQGQQVVDHLLAGRIALYSLGNLAAHEAARAALLSAGLPRNLETLQLKRDATLASYGARLATKLGAG